MGQIGSGAAGVAVAGVTAAGGALNITTAGTGAATVTTTTLNDATGILTGRVTYNGGDWATSAAAQTTASITWTQSNNTISIGNLTNRAQVVFAGTAPGGLTAGTVYYVVNPTSTTFQVSTTPGGAVVGLSNSGTTAQVITAGAIAALPLGSYTPYTSASSPAGTDANNALATDNVTLGGNWTTNSLKVTNTAAGNSLTIPASNTLTLTSGGLLFTGTSAYTIQGGTVIAGTGSNGTNTDLVVQDYGAGTLTINSVIGAGTGAQTLTKAGTGTLVLGGINTYTGATYVNGGVLSISNINQLGATAGATMYMDGGTLQYTGGGTASTSHPIALNGGGTIDLRSATTLTISGAVSGSALSVTSSDNSNSILYLRDREKITFTIPQRRGEIV